MHIKFNYIRRAGISRVRLRWIISCMSLSLIPIIIGIAVFFFSRREYVRQTLDNNEVLLTQVQSLLDQNLYDIRTIAANILSCNELANFCGQLKETPQKRSYTKMQLRESLEDFAGQNSYISGIYLYFWDTKEFVTDTTAATPDIIYLSYHKNDRLLLEQWLNEISETYSSNSIAIPLSSGGETLAYIKTLPSIGTINTELSIIVLIDQNRLISLAKNIVEKSGCYWNVLSGSREFVLGATQDMQLALSQNELPNQQDGILRISAGNGHTLSLLSSNILDVIYWMQTPPSVYAQAKRTINIVFICGLILVILGCIGFTIFFVSHNYSPIQKLLQLVPQWNMSSPDSKIDEYSVIMEAFTSTQMASTRLEEQLSKQDTLLMDTSLTLMLKKSLDTQSRTETLEQLKRAYPFPFFTLLVLSPGTNDQGIALYPAQDEDLQVFLQKIGQGICQNEALGRFHLLRQGECLILLLNTSTDLWEFWQEHFQDITWKLNCWAAENSLPAPLLALSKSRESLEQLADCYAEARYDIQYQIVFGVSIEEHQIQTDPPRTLENILYSSDDERRLTGTLLSGNPEQAKEALQEIWKNNCKAVPSKTYLRCLLYQFIGTMFRSVNMLPNATGLERTFHETLYLLQQGEEPERIYTRVEQIASKVCSLYAKEHEQAESRLQSDVLHYINEHYSDINLSVESLCSIFGKSRTYLFSLFKEDTGFGLMYHIARVRIENAKRLLRDTELTIQEIALQVGFNSAMSFTRAFKKYENMAPSRYREFNRKNQKDIDSKS